MEDEKPPSDSSIARFLKRTQITLQRVRDHKERTVEERLPEIKDWFLREDALQRERAGDRGYRIAPEDSYCADEFSIVIAPKTKSSYNLKGCESNQVKDHDYLASRSASGLVTFRYGGDPIGKLHIIFPLAPKKIWDIDENGKKFVKGWDVRTPASAVIKKEMKGWAKYKNIVPLFWRTAMAREPIIRAYGEDLRKWAGHSSSEKLLQLDWYDSHTDEDFLTDLKVKGNFIVLFYPNKCTDILATCDGGLIKNLQDDFRRKVDRELEEHFDTMTGSDTISRRVQRDFIIKTYNRSIEVISTERVRRIALRGGALFSLSSSLEKQFENVKLRGFTVDESEEKQEARQFRYRNVFEGLDDEKSEEARKLWSSQEEERKKKQVGIVKSKKRKGKRKSNLPKKKHRVMESVDFKDDLEANRSVDPLLPEGSQVGSGGDDAGEGLPEEKEVLRGGQIAFRNRKARTMSLLNSLND